MVHGGKGVSRLQKAGDIPCQCLVNTELARDVLGAAGIGADIVVQLDERGAELSDTSPAFRFEFSHSRDPKPSTLRTVILQKTRRNVQENFQLEIQIYVDMRFSISIITLV